MRAITVRQPWAHLIVTGAKLVEHRSWRTHHRGALLIHAGQEIDQDGPEIKQLVLGAIIGVVELVDVFERGGRFGWRLANPRQFKQPVECRGRLSLWLPPRRVLAQLR
jgi:hypothetical protein